MTRAMRDHDEDVEESRPGGRATERDAVGIYFTEMGRFLATHGYRSTPQLLASLTLEGPSASELAEELDMSLYEVSDTLKISGRHLSMDAPFAQGEDNRLLDVIQDERQPAPDNELMKESLSREVERALSTLSEREAEVIRLYFGLGREHSLTLEEIGEKFKLTRERVRQIKEKAIRRLRHASRSKQLRAYLG